MLTPPKNVLLPEAYWQWAGRKPDVGKYAPRQILQLAPHEVFVFGSNASGFHGAGAAGWAYCGKTGNQYRVGNPLLKAPSGTKGFWTVLGCARGFQDGNQGRSYAIMTITQPGHKRSVPLQEIRNQVELLYKFAGQNPQYTFLVVQTGETGRPSLNGYTLEENASCYLDQATE